MLTRKKSCIGHFENEKQLKEDFYNLILEAADGNETRAKALFNKLGQADIKCIADFDCSYLLNMQRLPGIGKVYGKILKEMFYIRIRELRGHKKETPVPIDMVLKKEEPA